MQQGLDGDRERNTTTGAPVAGDHHPHHCLLLSRTAAPQRAAAEPGLHRDRRSHLQLDLLLAAAQPDVAPGRDPVVVAGRKAVRRERLAAEGMQRSHRRLADTRRRTRQAQQGDVAGRALAGRPAFLEHDRVTPRRSQTRKLDADALPRARALRRPGPHARTSTGDRC